MQSLANYQAGPIYPVNRDNCTVHITVKDRKLEAGESTKHSPLQHITKKEEKRFKSDGSKDIVQ